MLDKCSTICPIERILSTSSPLSTASTDDDVISNKSSNIKSFLYFVYCILSLSLFEIAYPMVPPDTVDITSSVEEEVERLRLG